VVARSAAPATSATAAATPNFMCERLLVCWADLSSETRGAVAALSGLLDTPPLTCQLDGVPDGGDSNEPYTFIAIVNLASLLVGR